MGIILTLSSINFILTLSMSMDSRSAIKTRENIILRHNVIQSSEKIRKKAPIVILHGLLGSARNLQSFSKQLYKCLKNEHDVIVMDARNHGRSVHEDNMVMNYELMVGDLKETLMTLNIDECHIIGHSMGGKTAAYAALDHSLQNRILSLIVMDISPIPYEESEFTNVFETVQLCLLAAEKLKYMKTKQEVSDYLTTKVETPSELAFLLSNIESISPCGFAWKFRIQGISNSLLNIRSFPYSLVNIPTKPYYGKMLLLKASDSKFIRSIHLETIKALFPNFQLASVRGAGHNLHIEKPVETIDIINKFYSSFQSSL